MLSSVVLINEALNVGDRAAVWKQLSSTLTGLSNVEDEYAQRWEYGTAQSEMGGWNMQSESVLFTLRHIHGLILHALSVHVILKKKILIFHQIYNSLLSLWNDFQLKVTGCMGHWIVNY